MDVPSECNSSVRVKGKLSEYKDLEIEIIEAQGLVKKGIEKYTDYIPKKIRSKKSRRAPSWNSVLNTESSINQVEVTKYPLEPKENLFLNPVL